MERTTELTITSPTTITMRNARNGSMGLVVRDGKVYAAGVGGAQLHLSAAKLAEVMTAVAAYDPGEHVVKRGYEMTDADRQHDWTFCAVEDDAHGRYARTIREATYPVVMIGRQDLV